VYVLNNPTTLTDPLGLGPCDRNPNSAACNHEPHIIDIIDGTDNGFDCDFFFGCDWGFGFLIGGGAGSRGGGGTSGGGTTGSTFRQKPLPCVDPSVLQAAIVAALNGVFGPVQPISNRQVGPPRVQGGGNDFDFPGVTISPTQLPPDIKRINPVLGKIFNHPQKYQVYVPQPSDSVPGPGKVLHVTFDEGPVDPNTHLPVLTKISAHFDLSNPVQGDLAGLAGHVLGDILAAAIAQHLQHGCGVKFQ
jgi:hypothetical protein